MAAPDDPNVVRAVIERQIEYLGEQVSRIDGEHEEIRDKLEEVRRELTDASETLSALDLRIRTMLKRVSGMGMMSMQLQSVAAVATCWTGDLRQEIHGRSRFGCRDRQCFHDRRCVE